MTAHKGPTGVEHEHIDVDPFIPTGLCAVCQGVDQDTRDPDDRTPENPYDPGAAPGTGD